MKNRIRFAITLAGAVLCALPNLAIAQSGPGDSQGGQAAATEGTWIVTSTVAPGVSFPILTSFTAGGVILATSAFDRHPPFAAPTAPVSPWHGSWSRLDNNTYVYTLNFFSFDTMGNAVNMLQSNVTYQLTDNNQLVGIGNISQCDIDGNNCSLLGSFTITGKRLIAQGV